MARGRSGKRPGRKAYLKKAKHLYDPYSPYALRTRGVKGIDLASPIPTTVLSGNRTLTLARSIGFNAVEPAITAVKARIEERRDAAVVMQHWQTWKFQGKLGGCREWSRIKLREDRHICYELWFEGGEWIIFFEDVIKMVHMRSRVYTSRDKAMNAYKTSTIYWKEVVKIPPRTPPNSQSGP